ncbi:DegT/DnrJ/EryC1/StrS family aminotransferase, partial [Candidatus Bathyarchaeota archaeon]|nr:DegT/DnrJ/EryC1/StrS family aminotransferase [Candidatus Bathyarchaeota archaeon]
LSSGALREDTVTKRFEDCFATRIDARYAYAVSSGTAALHLALMSCTNKGKEVIVPAFTFFASASTVIHSGRRPVLVDVDPETFLMDTDMMNEAIGDETAALMPVHLFGNMVDLDVLGDVAEDHGLTVVHDCAQSLGSTYRGWDIGSFDDMCCFSFYPTKIITTGEGGMVTTNSEELSMKGRRLKSHGESEKYLHEEVGYNYRFTEVGSVLGLSQMRGIERFLERRRATAMY